MNVEMPDAKSAIEHRYEVVAWSQWSPPAISSGGVQIETTIANRCWSAAKSDSKKGGRASIP